MKKIKSSQNSNLRTKQDAKEETDPKNVRSIWPIVNGPVRYDFVLPSTEQLAMLAAVLAPNITGKAKDQAHFQRVLISFAMGLWQEATQAIDTVKDGRLQFRRLIVGLTQNEHLLPKKYPIRRDEFLRAMLPQYKYRPKKLAQLAKTFLVDLASSIGRKVLTKDEVNQLYGTWPDLLESTEANSTANDFVDWYRHHVAGKHRIGGLKSAARIVDAKAKAAAEKKLKKTR